MAFHHWLLVLGGLLLAIALIHPAVKRLPITTTILYLAVGLVLGPFGVGALNIDPRRDTAWLHHAAEVAVIISLFTVAMKLRIGFRERPLRPAIGLAFGSMALTVAMVAGVGVTWTGLPLGAAILLGAVLAPTDPVLASDVQLRHAGDRDKLRLTLSAESGLNDGTAFPFVFLGLGLLGLHELGAGGWRWWLVDVVWAGAGGLGIGWFLGHGIGRLLVRLHARRKNGIAFGEYVVIGLIGISYGIAVQVQAYGFLAVFAAGLGLRSAERRAVRQADRGDDRPKESAAQLTSTLLSTNEQLEHVLEVAIVILVGASLAQIDFLPEVWWFAPLLFLVIRPLACLPVVWSAGFTRFEAAAVGWFGIRGIGSVYYIMFALDHGLDGPLADRLVSITLLVIALSVVVHGISVTPLFERRFRR